MVVLVDKTIVDEYRDLLIFILIVILAWGCTFFLMAAQGNSPSSSIPMPDYRVSGEVYSGNSFVDNAVLRVEWECNEWEENVKVVDGVYHVKVPVPGEIDPVVGTLPNHVGTAVFYIDGTKVGEKEIVPGLVEVMDIKLNHEAENEVEYGDVKG